MLQFYSINLFFHQKELLFRSWPDSPGPLAKPLNSSGSAFPFQTAVESPLFSTSASHPVLSAKTAEFLRFWGRARSWMGIPFLDMSVCKHHSCTPASNYGFFLAPATPCNQERVWFFHYLMRFGKILFFKKRLKAHSVKYLFDFPGLIFVVT